jgi:hypothetical protein
VLESFVLAHPHEYPHYERLRGIGPRHKWEQDTSFNAERDRLISDMVEEIGAIGVHDFEVGSYWKVHEWLLRNRGRYPLVEAEVLWVRKAMHGVMWGVIVGGEL